MTSVLVSTPLQLQLQLEHVRSQSSAGARPVQTRPVTKPTDSLPADGSQVVAVSNRFLILFISCGRVWFPGSMGWLCLDISGSSGSKPGTIVAEVVEDDVDDASAAITEPVLGVEVGLEERIYLSRSLGGEDIFRSDNNCGSVDSGVGDWGIEVDPDTGLEVIR